MNNTKQQKKTYEILVYACHEETVFEMKLTEQEAEIVERVAKKCRKVSKTMCMPKMTIVNLQEP